VPGYRVYLIQREHMVDRLPIAAANDDGARKVASDLAENHGVDSFQVWHGPRLIDCGYIRPAIGTVWLSGHWLPSSG